MLERLEARAVLSIFTVSNTSNDPSANGSLPFAVAQADADASGTAITINFDEAAGHTFATAQTITLAGSLTLNNTHAGAAITIKGPAAGVTIAGGGNSSDFGVIVVTAGTTAILKGASGSDPLTITSGHQSNPGENGAGIDNSGALIVTNAAITNNSSDLGEGGGIESDIGATLLVSNTTIAGNVSGGTGGGINNLGTAALSDCNIANNSLNSNGASGAGIENNGTLTVFRSTLSGNTTGSGGTLGGGGLENFNGTATVANSTFSGNFTSTNGGAINNFATLTVLNSTISGNTATNDAGCGIDNNNGSGTLVLLNSIVAGNAVGAGQTNSDVDLSRQTTAQNDLIGDFHGVQSAGLADGLLGNIIGHPALLAPFGNYGGGTQTFALLPGSPALNNSTAIAGLTADVSASDTTIHVQALYTPPSPVLGQGYDILIDSEQMLVTAVSGSGSNFTLTVVRGDKGTTPAAHTLAVNNLIFLPTDQRGVAMPPIGSTDIGALQSQGWVVTVQPGDSPQLTPVSTAFPNPLGVTVTANDPNAPVDGGVITYTVIPGNNGGSATLSSPTATISGGSASVTATANGTADTYVVNASAGAGTQGIFQLTNTPAGSLVWTGLGTDANWNTAANWDLNRAPINGDSLVFPATAKQLANNNDVFGLTVQSMTFQGNFTTNTGGYTLSGDAVTVGAGGIADNGTIPGSDTTSLLNQINFNVTLGAAQSWSINDNNNFHHLTVNGNVANAGFALTATGNGTIDVPGQISGGGGLTVNGTGTLLTLDLEHSNSYTGGTTITKGFLDVFADGALGPGGTNDGGTTVAANGLLFLHGIAYNTPETLTLDGTLGNDGGTSSFAGPITITGAASGTGNGLPVPVDAQISDTSGGTFTLNGATLVNNGHASLFVNGGNLSLGGNSTVVIDNMMSGPGGLFVVSGAVQLGAANTYLGSTVLGGVGEADVGVDSAIPSASAVVMLAGGSDNALKLAGHSDTIGSLSDTESSGGTNTVDLGTGGTLATGGDNSSTTFAGSIHGAGGLVKQGRGTFDLSGASDFTGTTEVQRGTLLVDGSTTAASAVTVDKLATLGGAGTVAGPITVSFTGGPARAGTLSPGAGPDPAKDTGTLNNILGVTFQGGLVQSPAEFNGLE